MAFDFQSCLRPAAEANERHGIGQFFELRDAANGAVPAAHKQHIGLPEEFPSFKSRQFFQIIDAEKQIEPAR